ncbi:hypothetical protein OY671_010321, partial [Metschnikowia pulcherrima]
MDNPVSKSTMQQIDGIFGAERSGGWIGLSWNEAAARTAKDNIRTWGQVGVAGALAGQAITTYGQPNRGAGEVSYFASRVFGGARIWNENFREYADRKQSVADLAQDPAGIAYVPLAYRTAGVKPVALAETAAGPFVDSTRESVADRSYPSHRPVYLFYTIDNSKNEVSET